MSRFQKVTESVCGVPSLFASLNLQIGHTKVNKFEEESQL